MSRKPNTTCDICSKPIYRRPSDLKRFNRKYCSGECLGSLSTIRLCACGKELKPRQTSSCSRSCSNKSRAGISYKTGQKFNKALRSKNLKKRLVESGKTECEFCDNDFLEILVVHHIYEKCEGGTDDLWNLQLLCPNCHATEHYERRIRKLRG